MTESQPGTAAATASVSTAGTTAGAAPGSGAADRRDRLLDRVVAALDERDARAHTA